jgi:ketosteroid isomerase-like protein
MAAEVREDTPLDFARVEAVVRRVIAVWDARDIGAFVDCLTEDVEWYDPAMPDPPARGKEAVKAFAESVLRAFPDFRYEVLPPICVSGDGRRCAVKWRISGTHGLRWNRQGTHRPAAGRCSKGWTCSS